MLSKRVMTLQSDQSSGGSDRKEVLKSALSIEFAAWLAVFIPAFVAITLVLRPLGLPTWAVLGIGMLFGEATDIGVDWFTERYNRRVNGVETRAE